MPATVLTPAIRDEIARLGRADIMVGIPSFKNAATIGYVVRAAAGRPGPVLPRPPSRRRQLRRRLAGRHAARRRRDRAARLHRADPARPADQQARPGQPDLPRDRRRRWQGRRLRTIFEIAAALEVQALVVVDSDLRSIVPEWIELLAGPDPQGRLRLRRPALRPLQVRRHDHQHRHLPADPGALRPPHPPADRRRLRRVRRSRPPLPRSRTTGPTTSASSGSTSG